MSIGERIAEERKRLGFTQAALAQKMGISLISQKRYEANDRLPNIHYVGALSNLGISIGYVLTGSRSMSDNISFWSGFQRQTAEALAISVLELDEESFLDATSLLKSKDNDLELKRAILDALIENSQPLKERIEALKKSHRPKK